jgi:serine O-acetyltransferase
MIQPFSPESAIGIWAMSFIKGYNHVTYWRRRAAVVDPFNRTPVLLKLLYLYYIKKVDARHGCSFGTNLHTGASFATPPLLPHGPSGIFVGHDVTVGPEVTIFQQVTIAHGGGVIGGHVVLGAGSKVLAGRSIGDGAKIGANCVVVEDVPAHATAVMPKPRIILEDGIA